MSNTTKKKEYTCIKGDKEKLLGFSFKKILFIYFRIELLFEIKRLRKNCIGLVLFLIIQ